MVDLLHSPHINLPRHLNSALSVAAVHHVVPRAIVFTYRVRESVESDLSRSKAAVELGELRCKFEMLFRLILTYTVQRKCTDGQDMSAICADNLKGFCNVLSGPKAWFKKYSDCVLRQCTITGGDQEVYGT